MYRTYQKPINEKHVIMSWDGDCTYYSVFESAEEMEAEKDRLKKIDDEYKAQKKAYLESLECGE